MWCEETLLWDSAGIFMLTVTEMSERLQNGLFAGCVNACESQTPSLSEEKACTYTCDVGGGWVEAGYCSNFLLS